ncbi:MAG: GNAT family N-acetyltransferase, partial [Burkholderiales bacterium]|nr:GNAT family N-acetyltransferase [Anaerolineae bacterium]
LVHLRNAASVLDRDEGRDTQEELEHEFAAPNFTPEHDCFVAVSPTKQIIGYSSMKLDATTGRGFGQGAVHPYFRRQGIGTRLLHIADARLLERADEVSPDKLLSALRMTLDTHESNLALFAAEGYTLARSVHTLRVDLDSATMPPLLPDGFALRAFEPERDARAVYEADRESFRDHWGYVEWPFDLWRHYTLERAEFDPALWVIAYAGSEVAGMCIGFPAAADQPHSGYIDVLAVRRQWRRQGLGTALLQTAFHRFKGRSYHTIGLDVDADADEGSALALYERAGMRVYRRLLIYEKRLR